MKFFGKNFTGRVIIQIMKSVKPKKDVVIYQAKNGALELKGDFRHLIPRFTLGIKSRHTSLSIKAKTAISTSPNFLKLLG